MSILKAICGLAALAAIVPVKASVTKVGEEGNVKNSVHAEGLLYQFDMKPKQDAEGNYTDDTAVSVKMSQRMERIWNAVKGKAETVCDDVESAIKKHVKKDAPVNGEEEDSSENKNGEEE